MRPTVENVEKSADPFTVLTGLRSGNSEGFVELIQELMHSKSSHFGIWRYLSMHFIRAERYDLASEACEKYFLFSGRSEEALLQKFRIALLMRDMQSALKLLELTGGITNVFAVEFCNISFEMTFNTGTFPPSSRFERLKNSLHEAGLDILEKRTRQNLKESLEPSSNSQEIIEEKNLDNFSSLLKLFDGVDRITIVGNGGSLRGSNLGKVIDSQSMVVRLNFPNILDSAVDVGSKTDLMIFTEAFLHTKENLRSLALRTDPYVGVPGLAIDCARRKLSLESLNDEYYASKFVLTPIEFRDIIRAVSYEFATTGLCALILFSMIFEKEVSIYGFDFYSSLTKIHFFTDKSSEPFIGHETSFEKFLVKQIFQL